MQTSLRDRSLELLGSIGLHSVFAEALFGEAEENGRQQQPADDKQEAELEGLQVVDVDAFDHGTGPMFVENPTDAGLEDHGTNHVADIDGPGDGAEELRGDGFLSERKADDH